MFWFVFYLNQIYYFFLTNHQREFRLNKVSLQIKRQSKGLKIIIYSILSIQYEVPLISKVNPVVFPVNLLPKGDCGDKAITLTPSIATLGKATLRYK